MSEFFETMDGYAAAPVTAESLQKAFQKLWEGPSKAEVQHQIDCANAAAEILNAAPGCLMCAYIASIIQAQATVHPDEKKRFADHLETHK